MSFSAEWDSIYKARHQHTAWPWSELVGYVRRYGPPSLAGARVLELGCGSGANIPFFLSAGADYYAIEGSQAALDVVLQRYPELVGRVVLGDFTVDIPLPGQFDLIVDRSSLTHNTTEAIERTLRMLAQRLVPGGRLIGIDWFSDRHSDRQFGRAQDEHTLTDFSAGQFVNCGNVHFSDEAHLRALLADFRLLALEHKEVQNRLSPEQKVFASWHFAVEKPVVEQA
ncbi:class I SAM-dependent methyltransferase [Andreprevotia chitinilytica]|uniref:class I SAM-dependent methyltransferase n=1 Tax=Andreprevotia chitinilytica TaxID=396808 RepID=UPI0014701BEB|nr:class I SAM-dependent methyltransferase [Andreprevotia chitinilytica]